MGQNKDMVVRFFPFTMFHGKREAGSTNIRVNQVLKYWPEAGKYRYGEKTDVMIYQKVYWLPDYKYQEHFDGIQILDICDPDWLENAYVKQTVDLMDAVTCSSENLTNFMKQLTDKPVIHIPDRFDMEKVPPVKKHEGKARRAVWFGYFHNADLLKAAIPAIERLGLALSVISDDDPMFYLQAEDQQKFRESYKFHKYREEDVYKLLRRCDMCILPVGTRPKDMFKSNNRTIKAHLASLPVATNIDEMELYMDGQERQKVVKYNYDNAVKNYDIKLSVKQYKELINELKK